MKKFFCLLTLVAALTFLLTACGKLAVTWLDGDGSILYSEKVEKDAAIPEKPLPEDNDDWDYIEWSKSGDERAVTFSAVREAKDKYEWRDADGSLLYKESVLKGAPAPSFELPVDTDIYDYTEWSKSVENGVTVFTAVRYSGKTVLWKNVDGELLYTAFVRDGEADPERFLPNDTVDWHYTEWEKADYGFVAKRIAKERVHWLDVDGKELYLDGIVPGEDLKIREFPKNNKKWIYKEWVDITEAGGEKTFLAVADINPKYFVGNVFQVVVKDLYGVPQKLGSGFVFNNNGWFVTNYHVIEGAVTADAVFEIENYATGDSYTTLKISHAYYSSPEKDIFIGRIEDYSKISSYYQNIALVRDYTVGDKVYSVGYPNGTEKMEMNAGEVVDESQKRVNTLYSKLVKGPTYIPSTAFVAPGSSGGILVNENLDVIGITAGYLEEKGQFSVSAAIQVFNFQNTANNVSAKDAKEFIDFFYPLDGKLIKFFVNGETDKNCVGLKKDSSGTYYQYLFEYENKTGNDSTEGTEKVIIDVYDNGKVVCTRIYEWKIGHVSTSVLSGYYNGNPGSISTFSFKTTYKWPDGDGYIVSADSISYSADHKKSLAKCDLAAIGNIRVTDDNIDHARGMFNHTYERLSKFFNDIN